MRFFFLLFLLLSLFSLVAIKERKLCTVMSPAGYASKGVPEPTEPSGSEGEFSFEGGGGGLTQEINSELASFTNSPFEICPPPLTCGSPIYLKERGGRGPNGNEIKVIDSKNF